MFCCVIISAIDSWYPSLNLSKTSNVFLGNCQSILIEYFMSVINKKHPQKQNKLFYDTANNTVGFSTTFKTY